MGDEAARDDAYDRAVRELLGSVARLPTVAQADLALEVIRAHIVEKLRGAEDDGDGHDPDAAEILRLVRGRLHDATERGGTRR